MDTEFIAMLIKTLFSLLCVVFLIYMFVKLSGTSFQKLQNGKFVQIIERNAISKDNSILIVKMGNKYHLVTSTHDKLEVLRELDSEEEEKLLEKREPIKYTSFQEIYSNFKRKGRLK
jgi:flagellar protein FliO/FliZ